MRFSDQVEGRRRVVIVDAVQDDAEPGSVSVIEDADEHQEHAHHLSVAQSIQLLRLTMQAQFTLLGVSVRSVRLGETLSREIESRLPAIIDSVLAEVGSSGRPA